MMCILLLYLFTLIGAYLFRNKNLMVILTVTALSGLYMVWMIRAGKGTWTYDTVMCYPYGMLFALYLDSPLSGKVRKVITGAANGRRSDAGGGLPEEGAAKVRVWARCLQVVLPFLLLLSIRYVRRHPVYGPMDKEVTALIFITALVLGTTYVKVGNKALYWLGQHVFEVYIMQRIPMMLLVPLQQISKGLYLAVSFSAAIIIAAVYRKFLGWLLGKIRL